MAKRNIVYSEPADYFPESVRKELKIGEYAPKEEQPTAIATEQEKNVENKQDVK